MNNLKTIFLTISILAFTACVSAQDTTPKPDKKVDDKIITCQSPDLITAETIKNIGENSNNQITMENIKIIGENSDAQVLKPFIFAARSAETYKLLQEKIKDLPTEIDWTKQAVIAAFGGEQTSGGYSVSISQKGDIFSVKLNKPAPGAITTDALTYPFQIVIVAIEEEKSLMLETSEIWKTASENYKISGGKFDYSGGFAGRKRSIKPSGTISVWRFEDLVTFVFNLTGTDNKNLNSIATGKSTDNKVHFARFEAGEFYESPHPPLVADAVFKNNKISISLESGKRDYTVNDGFVGDGKIEAIKVN